MKKICAITMARNDEFFLEKWINYYGNCFGEENLYILLDGEDQSIPVNSGKANVIKYPRISKQVIAAEKMRLLILSQKAAQLLKEYDLVVGTDADEYLLVDPKCNYTLSEYLNQIDCPVCMSGLGMDVGQNLNKESEIDGGKLFLQQRSYAFVSSRYTKPVIVSKPVHWGSGFHRVKGHNFHIDANLYLFHFGCFDKNMLKSRFSDKDRMAAGWARHIKKRFRTINFVTNKTAKNGDKYLPIARIFQTICRPIYALNKPSMACWHLVVTIPERFKNVL